MVALLVSIFGFAQIPTGDEIFTYDFTNGDYSNSNGSLFIFPVTGNVQTIPDRFNGANNALNLNGDYLSRADVSYSREMTMSYWIKTDVNDINTRRIVDDKQGNNEGFYTYIKDGKPGILLKHRRDNFGGPINFLEFNFDSAVTINDGAWHNITYTLDFDTTVPSGGGFGNHQYNVRIYVDGVREDFISQAASAQVAFIDDVDNNGTFSVGQNRAVTLPTTERYMDVFDDFRMFDRLLTDAEVSNLVTNNNFCVAPPVNDFTIFEVEASSVTVGTTLQENLDITVVNAGQLPTSGAVINYMADGSNTVTIDNLPTGAGLVAYVRRSCMNGTSEWARIGAFSTRTVIYLSENANGNENGTTWADAFTQITDAIATFTGSEEIWIAGTFTPDGNTGQTRTITLAQDNLVLVGGFAAGDTSKLNRNFSANPSIFTGDLLGNDTNLSIFNDPSKIDNAFHVVTITGNNVTLDGITISGGNANGTVVNQTIGSALYMDSSTIDVINLINTRFSGNVSNLEGTVYVSSNNTANINLNIKACSFSNNLARAGAALVVERAISGVIFNNIVNSEFSNNTTNDVIVGDGESGVYISRGTVGNAVVRNLINNCTFANNQFLGANNGTTTSVIVTDSAMAYADLLVNNTIVWGNVDNMGNTAQSFGGLRSTINNKPTLKNCTQETKFSNTPTLSFLNNIVFDANPVFTNPMNGDFSLSPVSAVIDLGDAALIPVGINTDINNNDRIVANGVDLGAHEFNGTVATFVAVDQNATGDGTGSDWANAITSFDDALRFHQNKQIWLRGGQTFARNTASRNDSFIINVDGAEIYGGFNGTETMLSQRILDSSNESVITGDLNGNDNNIIAFGNPAYNDNLLHVIRINSNNVILDGITITGGNSNGSGLDSLGSAIYSRDNNDQFTARNVKIAGNFSLGGTIYFRKFDQNNDIVNFTMDFDKCIVTNNIATAYTAMRFEYGDTDITMKINLSNSLIANNKAQDLSSAGGNSLFAFIGSGGSSIPNWQITFVNNTIANNQMDATGGSQGNPALIINEERGTNSFFKFYNNIIYGNKKGVNTIVTYGAADPFRPIATPDIDFNIDEEGFSNHPTATNTLQIDPMFTASSTGDYTLMSMSQAVNSGLDTNIIPGFNQDIQNAMRIQGGRVDLGAYERTFGNCDPSNFIFSNVLETSLQLDWTADPSVSEWDVAYHLTSQPFSTATILSGLNSTSVNITGLVSSEEYSFFVRGVCNGTPADYFFAGNIRTLRSPIFVSDTATGMNNGTSWTNAYTDLSLALANEPESDFYIKAGTYSPGTSTSDKFIVTTNQKLYGGFNGTETMVSQRDAMANITILSGDVNGNDTGNININESTRNDNNLRLMNVTGTVILDGLTFSGGNARGSGAGNQEGSAINIAGASNLTIVDCIFENNTANRGGTIRIIDQAADITLDMNRTIFRNNMSVFATIYYGRSSGSQQIDVNMNNVLIHNNTAISLNTPLIWLRQDVAGNQNLILNNSTITDNTSSSQPVINTVLNSGGTSSTSIYNSIFWNNLTSTGQPTAATTNAGTVKVRNSLSNDGFTVITDKQNVLSTDPQFVNVMAGDYSLQSSSPAKDFGDNQWLTDVNSLDLAGNARVFAPSVDLGAYEYNATLSTNDQALAINTLKIYPNPTSEFLNVKMKDNLSLEKVQIINLQGQTVIEANSNQIYVGKLATGIYIVSVTDATGRTLVKRFIKQ